MMVPITEEIAINTNKLIAKRMDDINSNVRTNRPRLGLVATLLLAAMVQSSFQKQPHIANMHSTLTMWDETTQHSEYANYAYSYLFLLISNLQCNLLQL